MVVNALMNMAKLGLTYRAVAKFVLPGIHYSSLAKRANLWAAKGVFEKVWANLVLEYSEEQLSKDKESFRNIFIDSTMIRNDLGIDGLGRNPSDRGRPATKLSVIVDQNKVPISGTFYGANQHDSTTTLESVEAIQCFLKCDERMSNNLIGDKAYISEDISNELWTSKRIKKVTEHRRPRKGSQSARKLLPKRESMMMKKRWVVEHFFADFKKHRRVQTRRDRFLINFESFTFLVFCILTLKVKLSITAHNKTA